MTPLPPQPEWNRIIAERCDYKYDDKKGNGFHVMEVTPKGLIPNYIGSLDAMAEAEETIPADKFDRYVNCLKIVIGNQMLENYREVFSYCATALQRAEAFIRATNP